MNKKIKLWEFGENNLNMKFYDSETSDIAKNIIPEIVSQDQYGVKSMECKNDDIIIDIGANVGVFSIYMAKKFPNIRIYSFEPSRFCFDCLVRNIILNGVDKIVVPINKAVYSKSNEIVNLEHANTYVCSKIENILSLREPQELFKKKETVETISFDDILEKYDISKCRMVKMDCEGSEYEIIYNSKKFIKEYIDSVAIEIHPIKGYSCGDLYSHLLKTFDKSSIKKNILGAEFSL